MATGTTHALVGATSTFGVGVLAGPLVGIDNFALLAAFTAAGAGAAMLPDIDTARSTAATFLGPASKSVHVIVAKSSKIFMWLTRTRDDPHPTEHRGLSHTLLAAAAASFAATLTHGAPPVATVLMVSTLMVLGAGPLALGIILAIMATKPEMGTLIEATKCAWPLAVLVGYTIGGLWPDSLTPFGVAWWAPFFKKNGRRWRYTGSKRRMRSGGWVEKGPFVFLISLAWILEAWYYFSQR